MAPFNLKESAHIGEEFLGGSNGELFRKCSVAKQSVQDGDFPLEEALIIYNVSSEDYERFVAENALREIHVSLAGLTLTFKAAATVDVMAEMFKSVLTLVGKPHVTDASNMIVRHMETLAKNIKEDKVNL